MKVKTENRGFTLIELLTVIAILALLGGLMVPAINMVRDKAKETKQTAQLSIISIGITVYRNDYGEYPDSYMDATRTYYGAQKLCEAMVGRDLMGFDPATTWDPTGGTAYTTPPTERKDRYIDLDSIDAFKVGDLYPDADSGRVAFETYVLCDVFGRNDRRVMVGTEMKKAGCPILYYRANPGRPDAITIYNSMNNFVFCYMEDDRNGQGRANWGSNTNKFYLPDTEGGILDSKIANPPPNGYPHRPDSYILISAGLDGLYGTADDISNF